MQNISVLNIFGKIVKFSNADVPTIVQSSMQAKLMLKILKLFSSSDITT